MRLAAAGGNVTAMDRTILHIVCGDSRSRAEQARIVFALGHHAEVYGELRELLDRPPSEGIVMAADDGTPDMARDLIRQLGEAGMWLPVVMVSPQPETEQVVAAIKAGALDYLRLPLLKRSEIAVKQLFVIANYIAVTTVNERR